MNPLLRKKIYQYVEGEALDATQYDSIECEGFKIYVENEYVKKLVIHKFRQAADNGWFTPTTDFMNHFLPLAREKTQTINIFVLDVDMVSPSSYAYFDSELNEIRLPLDDTDTLILNFMHEVAHASLDLAGSYTNISLVFSNQEEKPPLFELTNLCPELPFNEEEGYGKRLRLALCTDFRTYQKDREARKFTKREKLIAEKIFRNARMNPHENIVYFAEHLCLTIEAMMLDEAKALAIAPNYIKILQEYVAFEKAKMLNQALDAEPQMRLQVNRETEMNPVNHKIYNYVEGEKLDPSQYQEITYCGFRFYAENQHVKDIIAISLKDAQLNAWQTPITGIIGKVIKLARVETVNLNLFVLDVKKVSPDAIALFNPGNKEIRLPATHATFFGSFIHEITHATFELAWKNPNNLAGKRAEFATRLLQALTTDRVAYKKNLDNKSVTEIEEIVAGIIFDDPRHRSYTKNEYFKEHLCHTMNALIYHEKTACKMAPTFISILQEYIDWEEMLYVGLKENEALKPTSHQLVEKNILVPVFENVKTQDLHEMIPPIQPLSVDEVRSLGFHEKPLCLKYVILPNGELILSREYTSPILLTPEQVDYYSNIPRGIRLSFSKGGDCFTINDGDILYVDKNDRPLQIKMRLKHPEIAGLKPVIAAGDCYVHNGKIVAQGIDNWTGHYQVNGPHLKTVVESTFYAAGYSEANGLYFNKAGHKGFGKLSISPKSSSNVPFNMPNDAPKALPLKQPNNNSLSCDNSKMADTVHPEAEPVLVNRKNNQPQHMKHFNEVPYIKSPEVTPEFDKPVIEGNMQAKHLELTPLNNNKPILPPSEPNATIESHQSGNSLVVKNKPPVVHPSKEPKYLDGRKVTCKNPVIEVTGEIKAVPESSAAKLAPNLLNAGLFGLAAYKHAEKSNQHFSENGEESIINARDIGVGLACGYIEFKALSAVCKLHPIVAPVLGFALVAAATDNPLTVYEDSGQKIINNTNLSDEQKYEQIDRQSEFVEAAPTHAVLKPVGQAVHAVVDTVRDAVLAVVGHDPHKAYDEACQNIINNPTLSQEAKYDLIDSKAELLEGAPIYSAASLAAKAVNVVIDAASVATTHDPHKAYDEACQKIINNPTLSLEAIYEQIDSKAELLEAVPIGALIKPLGQAVEVAKAWCDNAFPGINHESKAIFQPEQCNKQSVHALDNLNTALKQSAGLNAHHRDNQGDILSNTLVKPNRYSLTGAPSSLHKDKGWKSSLTNQLDTNLSFNQKVSTPFHFNAPIKERGKIDPLDPNNRPLPYNNNGITNANPNLRFLGIEFTGCHVKAHTSDGKIAGGCVTFSFQGGPVAIAAAVVIVSVVYIFESIFDHNKRKEAKKKEKRVNRQCEEILSESQVNKNIKRCDKINEKIKKYNETTSSEEKATLKEEILADIDEADKALQHSANVFNFYVTNKNKKMDYPGKHHEHHSKKPDKETVEFAESSLATVGTYQFNLAILKDQFNLGNYGQQFNRLIKQFLSGEITRETFTMFWTVLCNNSFSEADKLEERIKANSNHNKKDLDNVRKIKNSLPKDSYSSQYLDYYDSAMVFSGLIAQLFKGDLTPDEFKTLWAKTVNQTQDEFSSKKNLSDKATKTIITNLMATLPATNDCDKYLVPYSFITVSTQFNADRQALIEKFNNTEISEEEFIKEWNNANFHFDLYTNQLKQEIFGVGLWNAFLTFMNEMDSYSSNVCVLDKLHGVILSKNINTLKAYIKINPEGNIQNLMDKIKDQWNAIKDKKNYANLIIFTANLVSEHKDYPLALSLCSDILQLQPDNSDAFISMLCIHLAKDSSLKEMRAVISEHKSTFEKDKRIENLMVCCEALASHDSQLLTDAFHHHAKILEDISERDFFMTRCLAMLDTNDDSLRRVDMKIVHRDVGKVLHIQEHLDILKSKLDKRDTILKDKLEADAHAQQDYDKKLEQNQKEIEGYMEKAIARIHFDKNKNWFNVINKLNYGHLGTDICFKLMTDYVKNNADANNPLSIKPTEQKTKYLEHGKQVGTNLFGLFKGLCEDKINENAGGQHDLVVRGTYSDANKNYLENHTLPKPTGIVNSVNDFYKAHNTKIVFCKLMVSTVDLILHHQYTNYQNESKDNKQSFEQWLTALVNTNVLTQSAYGLFQAGRTSLDILTVVKTVANLSMVSSNPLSITRATVHAIFALPRFLKLVEWLAGPDEVNGIINKNKAILNALLQNFIGSEWQQLFSQHEDTVLHLLIDLFRNSSSISTYFDATELSKLISDHSETILNTLFVGKAISASTAFVMNTEDMDNKNRIQTIKNQTHHVLELLGDSALSDARRADLRKQAATLYGSLKQASLDYVKINPDSRVTYVQALLSQHIFNSTLELESYKPDGNAFHAIACYTDESATQLRNMAADFIQTHNLTMHYFSPDQLEDKVRLIRESDAEVDNLLMIKVLTKVLNRPILIVSQDEGNNLELNFKAQGIINTEDLMEGYPIYILNGAKGYCALKVRGEFYFERQVERKLALLPRPQISMPEIDASIANNTALVSEVKLQSNKLTETMSELQQSVASLNALSDLGLFGGLKFPGATKQIARPSFK